MSLMPGHGLRHGRRTIAAAAAHQRHLKLFLPRSDSHGTELRVCSEQVALCAGVSAVQQRRRGRVRVRRGRGHGAATGTVTGGKSTATLRRLTKGPKTDKAAAWTTKQRAERQQRGVRTNAFTTIAMRQGEQGGGNNQMGGGGTTTRGRRGKTRRARSSRVASLWRVDGVP